MAYTTITKITVPATNAGYNLTDSADFTTMGTGSGNGVQFSWSSTDVVVMKNTTGGAAVYTLKLAPNTQITGVGGAITNPTNSVAAAKTEILRLTDVFRDTSTGLCQIDCDVAGSILVLTQ